VEAPLPVARGRLRRRSRSPDEVSGGVTSEPSLSR
jgi:hypothetical protein